MEGCNDHLAHARALERHDTQLEQNDKDHARHDNMFTELFTLTREIREQMMEIVQKRPREEDANKIAEQQGKLGTYKGIFYTICGAVGIAIVVGIVKLALGV